MNTPHAGGFSDAPGRSPDAPGHTLAVLLGIPFAKEAPRYASYCQSPYEICSFQISFSKNDLVVVFLGAGSLLKTKRS